MFFNLRFLFLHEVEYASKTQGAARKDATELSTCGGVIKLSWQWYLLCVIRFEHSPSESYWCEKRRGFESHLLMWKKSWVRFPLEAWVRIPLLSPGGEDWDRFMQALPQLEA